MEEKKSKSVKKSPVQGEVFGYRVVNSGDLLCPKCYDMDVKILGVHELKLPAMPIKREEIEHFICFHCKMLMGDWRVQSLEDLRSLQRELRNIEVELGGPNDITGASHTKSEKIKNGENARGKLLDLSDRVENCGMIVAFLDDIFCNRSPEEAELFSEEGLNGLHQVLNRLHDDIESVVDGIGEMMPEEKHGDPKQAQGGRP